jgi:hypothetical protein
MAGLGLTQALQGYQRGVEWRQQQDELQREKDIREQTNLANAAGAKVMQDAKTAHDLEQAQAMEAWANSGKAPQEFKAKPWQATPDLLLKASDAKGAELAKRGLWGPYTENFAQFAPIRHQVRQKAYADLLSRYDADGDPVALAKGAWPMVHDGTDIAGHSEEEAQALGLSGAETPALRESAGGNRDYGQSNASQVDAKARAGGKRYSFHLSNGETMGPLTGEQIREHVLRATMSPDQVMQYEFQKRLAADKRKADSDAEREKLGLQHEHKMAELGLSNMGRQEVADTRATATVTAAEKRGKAGGGSGGGGGKGSNVQSVQTDADGYKVLVFRDGSTKRLQIDGKPVRGESWSKRVDSLAKDIGKGLNGMGKSEEELRAKAETMLIGKAVPEEGKAAAPAAGPAPKKDGAPDLSKFFH